MTPFTDADLANWLNEQYETLIQKRRQSYELQPGEFTATMYAEAAGIPTSTANARLLKLRKADRIPARKELINAKWTWVYTKELK